MLEFQRRFRPRALAIGDRICLIAPSRFVTKKDVELAVVAIENAGFEAVVPDLILAREGQFGGDDHHRSTCLNAAFKDPKTRAVWAMRGGYGSGRLLPLLNTEAFQADPTWIVGFSDITALHAWADRQGVCALHAAVANTYKVTSLEDRLAIWAHLQSAEVPVEREPPVVGGNLSVLYSLLGTPYFPDVCGCWLLLEDLDEYLYHIDRMILALHLAGALDRMHGLIMGSFNDIHDNTVASGQGHDNPFGKDIRQIISDHVPADKPILWDAPIGHGTRNAPLTLGHSLPTDFQAQLT